MSLSKDDVMEKLASKEFDALVGELESDWLECKQSPYRLETDRQKLELAKDIAGLANAAGGLLLLGFATAKDPTHGADRIAEVKPFPLRRLWSEMCACPRARACAPGPSSEPCPSCSE
jgi:hypothetical protein